MFLENSWRFLISARGALFLEIAVRWPAYKLFTGRNNELKRMKKIIAVVFMFTHPNLRLLKKSSTALIKQILKLIAAIGFLKSVYLFYRHAFI
jgi:hypothetical protein